MSRQTFEIEFIEQQEIAPQVLQLAFERVDRVPFNYIPGQFITLHLDRSGQECRRSYSIACAPHPNSSRIEFALSYQKAGVASEVLFHLQPKQVLQATGPFGRLILADKPEQRIILVATGTGVTPYRAMLPELNKRMQNDNTEIVLLFGCRTRQDALYMDEFRQFAQTHPKMQYIVHYSRENAVQTADERLGYVQGSLTQAQLALQPESDLVYLCGNPGMIDEAYAKLLELGFPSPRIKREKYISSN
jgi:ferredoxin-NADP reductase